MEENKPLSLEERLARQTNVAAPAQQNSQPQSNDAKSQSDFWDQEEELSRAELEVMEEEQEDPEEPEKDPVEEKKPVKPAMTDKMKRASAATAVGMQDTVQRAIFTPLINWKYQKKFSEKEIDKLDEGGLVDMDPSKIQNDEDRKLRNKFDRLMRRRDKKLSDVEMTPKEKQNLEEAWYHYFQHTEKELPPIYLVLMSSLNSIGSRVVDIITD